MRIGDSVQVAYGQGGTDAEYCDYQYRGVIKHIGVTRIEIEVMAEPGPFTIGVDKTWLKESGPAEWELLLLPTEQDDA